MQTSLRGIAKRAKQEKKYQFGNIYGMLDKNALYQAWMDINKKAEAGVDKVMKMNLNEEDALSDEKVVKDLVLSIKAPLRGTWPTKSELYINGKEVNCIRRENSF